VLGPVELSVAIRDPQFVKMFVALDKTRERERVEEFVREDEMGTVARDFIERAHKVKITVFERFTTEPLEGAVDPEESEARGPRPEA